MKSEKKEYNSNIMRAEIVKKILKDRGYTVEQVAKKVDDTFNLGNKDTSGAIKASLNSQLGDDWCERLEIVLGLPKDTLKHIK